MLHGLASAHARQIELARGRAPFRSMDDFVRRTALSRSVLTRLAKAGAFGSLGFDRREALWHTLEHDQVELPLFDCSVRETHRRAVCEESYSSAAPNETPEPVAGDKPDPCTQPALPGISPAEEVLADYRAMGLSLKAHPMQFLRPDLDAINVVPAGRLKRLPDGRPVCVAGLVLVRQRPATAKGITFVTLEDETGTVNLIVRPGIWKRHRAAALGATVLLARGRLQRRGESIHLLTGSLEDLSGRMRELGGQSRDFC